MTMMKKINLLLIACCTVLLLSCSSDKKHTEEEQSEHQENAVATPEVAKEAKSPAKQVMENIGDTHIHIEYNAPSIRGRVVFGGLVPYNQVWVTGAHNATSIQFNGNVEFNGNKVIKGKYALFTIPGETEWTVILNRNFEQHLADDYDAEQDVIRFQVTPKKLGKTQEQLLFEVTPIEGNHGEISISWADVKLTFNVEAD